VPLPPPVAATTVQRGWRVSGGWLLVTSGRDGLVLVSTAGALRWHSPGLVDAVSADGTTLVWWDGSRVRYGRIGPDGVTGAVDVAFPPGTEDPQADVDGLWHGKVVLRYPAAGQLSSLALWDPAQPGTVAAGSDLQVVQTFGPAGDGRHLVVLTARADGGDPRCLVEVDPDRGFAPAGGNATACPADLPTVLIESPDHRWLGTPTAPGRGEPDRWYDLGTLFDGTPGTRTVPGCAVSGAGVTMITWEPAGSYLVVRTNDGAGHPVPVTFTRCRPGDPAATAVPDPRLAGATRVAVLATRSSTAWG
jgi:hypothetical protein